MCELKMSWSSVDVKMARKKAQTHTHTKKGAKPDQFLFVLKLLCLHFLAAVELPRASEPLLSLFRPARYCLYLVR